MLSFGVPIAAKNDAFTVGSDNYSEAQISTDKKSVDAHA